MDIMKLMEYVNHNVEILDKQKKNNVMMEIYLILMDVLQHV